VNEAASTLSLAGRYRYVRAATEALASPLSPEDQTVQSMPDVSPTKWHLAHTSWFFEAFVLAPYRSGYGRFDDSYAFLFNSYYERMGSRHPRPERGLISRPGVAEIERYREHVDDAMSEWLSGPLEGGIEDLVELGLQHEQQHEELLLMDIKHVFSRNPTLPSYSPDGSDGRSTGHEGVAPAEWIEHEGGIAEIGHDGDGFCFDNERPRHDVILRPFALASRPVTCGEWLEFMEDGGYSRPELWLSEGWGAVCSGRWRAPLYWSEVDGEWSLFTLHGSRRIDPLEPACHISYYEADAYATWAGRRLPSEEEWEVAARMEAQPGSGIGSAGQPAMGRRGAVPEWSGVVAALHPRAVGTSSPLMGDVWHWTRSSYSAYPGYRVPAGAVGEYNGKFMVSQYVLRGGCCVTPCGHARLTYRNFFPPSARWPFTGVRLAADR